MNIETTQHNPNIPLTPTHPHESEPTIMEQTSSRLRSLWDNREQIIDRTTHALKNIPQKMWDNRTEIALGSGTQIAVRTGLAAAGTATYAAGAIASAGAGAVRTYHREMRQFTPTKTNAPVHATRVFNRHHSKNELTDLPEDATTWNKITHYADKVWNSGEKLAINLTAGYRERNHTQAQVAQRLEADATSADILESYKYSTYTHKVPTLDLNLLRSENHIRVSEDQDGQPKAMLDLEFLSEDHQTILAHISQDISKLYVSHSLNQTYQGRDELNTQYIQLKNTALELADNDRQRTAISGYIRQQMKTYYRDQAKNAIKGIAAAQVYKAPLKYAATLGVLKLDEHTFDIHGKTARLASNVTQRALSFTSRLTHDQSTDTSPAPNVNQHPHFNPPTQTQAQIEPLPYNVESEQPKIIPFKQQPSIPDHQPNVAPAMEEAGYTPAQLTPEEQTRIQEIQAKLKALKETHPPKQIRIRPTPTQPEDTKSMIQSYINEHQPQENITENSNIQDYRNNTEQQSLSNQTTPKPPTEAASPLIESNPNPESLIDFRQPGLSIETNIVYPSESNGMTLQASGQSFWLNDGHPTEFIDKQKFYEQITVTRLPGYETQDSLSTEPGSSFLLWFCTEKQNDTFTGRGIIQFVSEDTDLDNLSAIQDPQFIIEAHSYGTTTGNLHTYYPGEPFRKFLGKISGSTQLKDQFIDTKGKLHINLTDKDGNVNTFVSTTAIDVDLINNPGFGYLEVKQLFQKLTKEAITQHNSPTQN